MSVLWVGLIQGLSGVWTIARVVIPLIIVLEILQANGILQRLNKVLSRLFHWIGLSEEGAFPVVVAIFFGLTFGSSVIISYLEEGKVTEKETRIIGVFIALCHALVEDTAIFMAVGVPIIFLLIPRLFAAYVWCWGINRVMQWRTQNSLAVRQNT